LPFKKVKNLRNNNVKIIKYYFSMATNRVKKIFSKELRLFEIMSVDTKI